MGIVLSDTDGPDFLTMQSAFIPCAELPPG